MIGIYAIVCDKTWRSYVGQTVNLKNRFQDHLQLLRRNSHSNKELQADFNLHGESSFYCEMIESINDEKMLGIREAYWINFGCNLYNKTKPSVSTILTSDEQVRFWKCVNIQDTESCWNWIGYIEASGYGKIKIRRKPLSAHRVAYYLTNTQADINAIVRHLCNNKACCNPSHLIHGSYSENKRDISLDKNNIYKLNWQIIKELRQRYLTNPNISNLELKQWLSDKYQINVNRGYLRKVCQNKKWVDKSYIPPKSTIKYTVNQEEITKIINAYNLQYKGNKLLSYVNDILQIPIPLSSIWKIIRENKKEN